MGLGAAWGGIGFMGAVGAGMSVGLTGSGLIGVAGAGELVV